jgi:hypothetical protein
MTNKFKFKSFLLTTPHVKAMIAALKKINIKVETDFSAGTARAYFKDVEIFAALQKGHNQPWIVRHVVDLFEAQ